MDVVDNDFFAFVYIVCKEFLELLRVIIGRGSGDGNNSERVVSLPSIESPLVCLLMMFPILIINESMGTMRCHLVEERMVVNRMRMVVDSEKMLLSYDRRHTQI